VALIPVIQLEEFTVKAWTKGAKYRAIRNRTGVNSVHLLLSSKL